MNSWTDFLHAISQQTALFLLLHIDLVYQNKPLFTLLLVGLVLFAVLIETLKQPDVRSQSDQPFDETTDAAL